MDAGCVIFTLLSDRFCFIPLKSFGLNSVRMAGYLLIPTFCAGAWKSPGISIRKLAQSVKSETEERDYARLRVWLKYDPGIGRDISVKTFQDHERNF